MGSISTIQGASIDTIPPRPVIAPAPGLSPDQAKIDVKIIAVYSQPDSTAYLSLEVQRVYEYRASAPPIIPQDILTVHTHSKIRNPGGNNIQTFILQQNTSTKQTPKAAEWSLVNIKE